MKLLPAVVAELDDVVLVAMSLGVHNEAKQGFLLLLAVDHHPTPEEPMAAVLTRRQNTLAHPEGSLPITDRTTWGTDSPVGLGQVEALHAGGVALHPLKHGGVEVEIPGVERQTWVRNRGVWTF